MSTEILKNAFVEFDGTDLSQFVRSVTLSYEAETQDDTAMGDDTRSNIGGLFNWSAEVEMNQDFSSSAVDDTLFSKVGSTGTIKIRKDAGTVSSTNPTYSGDALLTSYPPIGGSVGDAHTTSASFVPGGAVPTLVRITT